MKVLPTLFKWWSLVDHDIFNVKRGWKVKCQPWPFLLIYSHCHIWLNISSENDFGFNSFQKINFSISSLYKCIKGLYLSKALTCMKIFLFKQELLSCQGDGYFWPHYCMNNLYISHRSLYAPTYSFWAIHSMLISLLRVTSWFDTVNNALTRWMSFRQNHLHEHDLQLFDYNI